ncbi:hypothetical protein BC936DRAFT_138519 [Jimgerdemannia flammicorona]|uniref:Uncharacterized protein n=1 Tax=Jimgerdemannia flammicorona TaxID=994334 RepID=A0A433DIF6_9FUNG|nr:hypothetical protein BC936DRAFT_138519 [Jimgerdemannia flammicorona]
MVMKSLAERKRRKEMKEFKWEILTKGEFWDMWADFYLLIESSIYILHNIAYGHMH